MTNAKSTKKALLSSVLSLFLCFAMLLGTTFAWFTDSVTSANNVIQSGNLDIELEYWNGTAWTDVAGKSDILTNTLWEPGVTEVAYLRVANAGSLALKYQLGINILSEIEGKNAAGETFKLSDYIQFGVIENIATDATTNAPAVYANRDAAVAAVTDAKKISAGYTKASSMTEGQELYLALVVWMPTTVGNEANHNGTDVPQIDLGINVIATQYTYEEDSFDKDYDTEAEYPIVVNATKKENIELPLNAGTKVGVTVPAAAPAGDYALDVSNKVMNTNTVTGTTEVSYDIDLLRDGVKVADGNAYEVSIYVGEGLSIAAVKHNGENVASYNYANGYVTFKTNSFSPFSVVYKNVVTTAAGLQTAINNAEDGTVVTIAEGTYNLPGQIQIDNKSITIIGEGNVVLNGAGAGAHVFQLRNAFVNGVANADVARDDIYVTFKNITISGSYKSAIMVRNDIDVTVENVTFNGTATWSHLQVENAYTPECADKIATITAKNITTPKFTLTAGAGHTTNFFYDNCDFGELQIDNGGGDVYVNGAKATPGTSTYAVTNSDELKAKIETAADGSTIILKAGDYAVRFTNNTTFNADNLTFVGEDGAKLSVSSSEVWFGRVQGDNVVFNNIQFTGTVGTTGTAIYNDCTFDSWTICATNNAKTTTFNNCDIAILNTSSDFDSGNVYVNDSKVTIAEYSFRGAYTMKFANCEIGELIPWDANTVLENCTVITLNDENMVNNTITTITEGEDGLFYATTSADPNALILYRIPADYAGTELTVKSGVTNLRSGLFANTNIVTVTIPASVTDFGASGVSDTNASGGAFKGSNVTTVILEDGIAAIPAAAFNGASKLTSVNIPASVKTIGVNAFRSTAITSLTVPATVETIGYGAFRDMLSLETVTIKGNNVTIPNYAFRGCTNLRTVTIEATTATIGTNMPFANASSNNPGTNDITFYCQNTAVADSVKASMGVGSYVAIYVNGELYAEIK